MYIHMNDFTMGTLTFRGMQCLWCPDLDQIFLKLVCYFNITEPRTFFQSINKFEDGVLILDDYQHACFKGIFDNHYGNIS